MLDPTEVNVPDAIRDLTGGAGADVAFECAGHRRRARESAIRSTRAGGTCVNVAIWGHEAVGRDERPGVLRDQPHRHARLLRATTRRPSGCSQDKKVDAVQFITGRIALDDIVGKGFRELIDNKEENVKILVTPKDLV